MYRQRFELSHYYVDAAKKRAGSQYYALASGPGSSPWGENLDKARDPSLIAKDFETSDLRYFAEKMAEMYVCVAPFGRMTRNAFSCPNFLPSWTA